MTIRRVLLALACAAVASPIAAQQSFVTMSPASRTTYTGSVVVTIAWCSYGQGTERFDINSRVVTANGVDITGEFDLTWSPAACGHSGPIGDEEFYVSVATVPVDTLTGPVTLLADVSNYWNYHWQAMETYYPPKPRRGVTVTAEQGNVRALTGTQRSERFTIRNDGNAPATYEGLVSGCSTGAIASSCSPWWLSIPLAPGASYVWTVTYTTSTTLDIVGTVTLTATDMEDGAVSASASTRVTIVSQPAVGVAIIGTAPGVNDVLPRGACVTIALAAGAASECGDLRLAHGAAPIITMGSARAPTLLYNSQHARPLPSVIATVRLSSSVALPPNVTACIKVANVSRGCQTWPGTAWGAPGNTRQIVVQGTSGTWTTGRVDYTLEVTTSNGNQPTYTATGRLYIVNRATSRYGAGWWLAGLEQLKVVHADTLVWIGGDGSARRYLKTGSVWMPSNFATRDSIIAVAGGRYARLTAEHARVYFNSAGRHDSTVNSVRHVTRFEYAASTDSLLRIRVPRPSGGFADFTFAYLGGKLDSISSPGGRGTKLFISAARVDSIRDPDGSRVRFGYGSGSNASVVVQRKDRQGIVATFAYDAGNRVASVTRPYASVLQIVAGETRGLVSPVELDSAFTLVDGPRADVSDISRFWTNGYGAPWRTRNAVGHESVMRYSSTWPGLVDSTRTHAGLASRAIYGARGLPDTVKVIGPFGGPDTAITAYKWHSSLNRPVSVRTRTAGTIYLVDSVSFYADSTMAWQQRGTGASPNRVNYAYTADRLPWSVTLPGNDVIQFAYDTLGNLGREVTPLGFVTLTVRDAVGRPDTVWTPRLAQDNTDAAVRVNGVRTITRYDRMGRDTLSVTRGPGVTLPNGRWVPADTIRIRKTYDEEGRPRTHSRFYSSNTGYAETPLFAMNDSQWEYDSLGRMLRKSDAGSNGWTTYTYDAAGNPIATTTPRGYTTTATYDAAGRLTRRLVPQVTYGSSPCHWYGTGCTYQFPTLEGPSLCVAADTARFKYDAAGNLRSAENNWAKVSRAYAPNGALLSETQVVRTYETEAAAPCGGGDRHAAAESIVGSDWAVHSYGLDYTYDLAGRRTSLALPDQLDPCSGRCVQLYKYNTTTGTLDTLIHPSKTGGSLTTRFVYDSQGRLSSTLHPGSVSTSRTYDGDGRVVARSAPLTSDQLTYDAAGRVVGGTVAPPSGGSLALAFGYNGLGALQWAQGIAPDITAEDVTTDALGTRLRMRDAGILDDGINRTRLNLVEAESGRVTGVTLGTGACSNYGTSYYFSSSCHPVWYSYESGQEYDASGNVQLTWEKQVNPQSQQFTADESRSYFAADETLTYFNRTIGWIQSPQQGNGTYDEYRYDALGRRVLTRTQRIGPCNEPCDAFIERTVHDGDQVLAEIRSVGKTGISTTYLEGEGTVEPTASGDLFGIVLNAHAQGIDAPVQVVKWRPASNLGNAVWNSVTPHADWKGTYAYGTYDDGSLCISLSTVCPAWPGYRVSSFGDDQGALPPDHVVWVGSLLRGRQDASGLTYLRNRYYDANTGRFTQQDPIGLSGGLNLYGFASGDPVNFSDPFGLCKDEKTGEKRPCKVDLSAEGRGAGTKMENLRPEVRQKLQELADAADVDLGINFTTNGRHTDPGHAAGTAVDIGEINGDDIGDGTVTYPGMMGLSRHVQSVAGRLGGLKSDPPFSGNLGPSGKFYGAEGPFRINTQRTREGHMNHIHLSYVLP